MRLALITGATSGIGKELALLLDQKKIPLLLCGRDEKKLQELKKCCTHVEALIVADLKESGERKKVIHAIETHLPDLVINNAGFGLYGEAFTLPLDKQNDLIEVNCKAPLEFTLCAVKNLAAKKEEGIIVNVSSIAGEVSNPLMAVYGASKAFLTQFSKAVDFEVKNKGIRVLVSLPGLVSSPFAEKAAGKPVFLPKAMTPKTAAKEILKQIEKKKGVQPFTFRYKIVLFLAKYVVPSFVIKKIIMNNLKKRL